MPAEGYRRGDGAAGDDGGGLFSLVIPARADAVRDALRATCDTPILKGLGEDARGTVELVIAEALNNIVEHAYATGGGEIELSLRLTGASLSVLITDRGTPMPRGALPAGVLPEARPDDLPEGGFGWYLIRSLSQDLRYCRAEGRNHLFFRLDADQARKQTA